MDLPFSQACENNKQPLLGVLKKHFQNVEVVLEIGSGTGQHGAYFAEQLPYLQWQPCDQADYLAGINAWRDYVQLPNLLPPLTLKVDQPWPVENATALFSANTLHIMAWHYVEVFFQQVEKILEPDGLACIYGPFNYNGQFTSESNASFQQWLQARDPVSGIRDFEAVNTLAQHAGLNLLQDYEMPANNRCLVWQRSR